MAGRWPLQTRESTVGSSVYCLFLFIDFYLFIYFWLCWVFVSVRGLPLVAASGGHSSSWCAGLSLSRPLLLRSTGSRRAGSVVVAHGPSCSVACGIFPDQGSNPCPLHWQADSQPLRRQGSPGSSVFADVYMFEPVKAYLCCNKAFLPLLPPQASLIPAEGIFSSSFPCEHHSVLAWCRCFGSFY